MSDKPSDIVRVKMSVPLSDGLLLSIDREYGHFHAIVGRWVVKTDGFGNLVVHALAASVFDEGNPILKVRAAE